ncbi:hypothetical protein KUTeg_006100 [Tegillarca granosa]|uniref:Uncharacterized protein n=1 Tax=Tegillarca granosa TaxID=220873 RepID=A0ABQ9FFJ3_TEGGR|nr:hypothetical protein KUTeg_006100 [Tegillarca granosa]
MINVAHVGGNILTISSSSSYAIENKDFLLHCTTKKVLKGIIWTRNGTRVAYMYVQSDTCGSIDAVSGLYLHYKYNCTDNTTYHLIIPGGRISQENGSKWQCKDSGGDGESDIHSLEVAVAPNTTPVISGYKNKPVITETIKMERQNQKEDITVDFYSIPKPLKVEWLKEGKEKEVELDVKDELKYEDLQTRRKTNVRKNINRNKDRDDLKYEDLQRSNETNVYDKPQTKRIGNDS